MDDHADIPLLLELLYGEEEGRIKDSASPRLLSWCRAFDKWLAERRRTRSEGIAGDSVNAWRRLLRQCPKAPWELAPEDIQAHAAWLLAQGYSPGTINSALSFISNFYRWCGERGIDPDCGPGFNPSAGVPRPPVKPWTGSELLSPAEVRALLGLLRRDDTPIGKRDYTFFLARLRTGVPQAALVRLRWGQIEAGCGGALVRWRTGAEPQPLPGEVWEAIQAYLVAGGRLAGMQAESYIFAPLVQHLTETAGSKAEDWREGVCLTAETLRNSLKLYGRLASIPEEKLNMHVLRSTSIRLQLDLGRSPAEMQAFLDTQDDLSNTKFRLRHLPQLPQGERANQQIGDPADQENEPLLPVRRGRLRPPGDGATHRYYSQVQPVDEVNAILAEGDQGIGEQIVGLRILARGLQQRLRQAHGSQFSRLSEAYLLASGRLARLIQAEDQIAVSSGISDYAQRFLEMSDQMAAGRGDPPVSPAILKEALGDGPELSASARHLLEETAGTRCILRNTFREAMQAQDDDEYARLVGIYGLACMDLLRLLKAKGSTRDRLDAYVRGVLDQALEDVIKEFGIGE